MSLTGLGINENNACTVKLNLLRHPTLTQNDQYHNPKNSKKLRKSQNIEGAILYIYAEPIY